MKDSEKLAGLVILMLFGIPGLVAITAILNGFVLTKLWQWFIMPQFGLEPLRIPFAIGLSLVIGFLTHQSDNKKDEHKKSTAETLIISIIHPFVILAIGYFVQMFI